MNTRSRLLMASALFLSAALSAADPVAPAAPQEQAPARPPIRVKLSRNTGRGTGMGLSPLKNPCKLFPGTQKTATCEYNGGEAVEVTMKGKTQQAVFNQPFALEGPHGKFTMTFMGLQTGDGNLLYGVVQTYLFATGDFNVTVQDGNVNGLFGDNVDKIFIESRRVTPKKPFEFRGEVYTAEVSDDESELILTPYKDLDKLGTVKLADTGDWQYELVLTDPRNADVTYAPDRDPSFVRVPPGEYRVSLRMRNPKKEILTTPGSLPKNIRVAAKKTTVLTITPPSSLEADFTCNKEKTQVVLTGLTLLGSKGERYEFSRGFAPQANITLITPDKEEKLKPLGFG